MPLTPEELDEVAFHIPHVEAWLKAVKAEILKALKEGAEMNNAKLEPTLGNRKWGPGVDVLQLLRKFSKLDVVAPRVPLSPTQAEKTLGKQLYAEKLAGFVVRESSGMKLTFDQAETEETE